MSEYILKINWVDIIILILLLRTSYVGFIQGLSYEILTLIGIITAVVLAIHNYKHVGRFFINHLNLPVEFSNFLSFLILVFGVIVIFRYIRNIFYRYAKLEIFPTLEKFGGLIFGFIRGCIFASLVLLILSLMPNDYIRKSIHEGSLGGTLFLKVAPTCYEHSIGLFPKYKNVEKTKIVEEMLKYEPSKKKVKSHIKTRFKKGN